MRDADPDPRAAYNALYRGTGFGETPRFYRWIHRLLGQPDGVILDVGCGSGGFGRACQHPERRVLGVDFAEEALRTGKRQQSGAWLVQADGERLPFRDGRFHAAVVLGSLEHYGHPLAGAREVQRVLRRGGRAIVSLPNGFYSGDLWRLLRTGYGPNHHQPIDRFASMNEWADLLRAAGFEVLETLAFNKFKWWKRLFPKALAYHFVYLLRVP